MLSCIFPSIFVPHLTTTTSNLRPLSQHTAECKHTEFIRYTKATNA